MRQDRDPDESAYKFWLAVGIASAIMSVCIFICCMILGESPPQ